jgi:mannose-6-phosphate isomerase-like protein (cupin superfamily)
VHGHARPERGEVDVRRADDRPELPIGSGVHWALLTGPEEGDIELLSTTYDVGGASSEDGALLTHAGRETGLIVSGVLHVTVEPATYELGPGDSISFDSTVPHRFWNEGPQPVRAVWLNVGRGRGRAGRITH